MIPLEIRGPRHLGPRESDTRCHKLVHPRPRAAYVLRYAQRNWLIAPSHVRGLSRLDGELSLTLGSQLRVPVARYRARDVRQRLLQNTVGLDDPL